MDKSQIVDKFKNVLGVREKLNVSYASLAPKKNVAGAGKDFKVKCSKCYFRSTSHDNLKLHMKEAHCREDLLSCPVCDYTASDENILNYHMESHPDVKRFKCPYCEFLTTSKVNFEVHTIKCHLKRYYFCKSCDFGTFNANEFSAHKLVHPPPPSPRTIYRSGSVEKHQFNTGNTKNENTLTGQVISGDLNELTHGRIVSHKAIPSHCTINKIKIICQISSSNKPPIASNNNKQEDEMCSTVNKKTSFKRPVPSPLPFQSKMFCVDSVDTSSECLNSVVGAYKSDLECVHDFDMTSCLPDDTKVSQVKVEENYEGESVKCTSFDLIDKNKETDSLIQDVNFLEVSCDDITTNGCHEPIEPICLESRDNSILTNVSMTKSNDKDQKSTITDKCMSFEGKCKKDSEDSFKENFNNSAALLYDVDYFDGDKIPFEGDTVNDLNEILLDKDDDVNGQGDLGMMSTLEANKLSHQNIEVSESCSETIASQDLFHNQNDNECSLKVYFEGCNLLNDKRLDDKVEVFEPDVVNVPERISTEQCFQQGSCGVDMKSGVDIESLLVKDGEFWDTASESNVAFNNSTCSSPEVRRFHVKDTASLKQSLKREDALRLDQPINGTLNPNNGLFEELIQAFNREDDVLSWNSSIAQLGDLDILPDLLSDHGLDDFNSSEINFSDKILSSLFNEDNKPSSIDSRLKLNDCEANQSPSDGDNFLSDFINTINFEESSIASCCSLNLIDMVNHEENYLNCLTDSMNQMYSSDLHRKCDERPRDTSKAHINDSVCCDRQDNMLQMNGDETMSVIDDQCATAGKNDHFKMPDWPNSLELDLKQFRKLNPKDAQPLNDLSQISMEKFKLIHTPQGNLNPSTFCGGAMVDKMNGFSVKFGKPVNPVVDSQPSFAINFNKRCLPFVQDRSKSYLDAYNRQIESPRTKNGYYPIVLST